MKFLKRIISGVLIFSLLLLFFSIPPMAEAQTNDKTNVSPSSYAVKIIAPQDGFIAKIGDRIDIMVIIKPGLKVDSIAILNDDGRGIGLISEAPFAVKWDTTGFNSGTYTLHAEAHLTDGRTLKSAPLEINLEGTAVPPVPAGTIVKEGTPVILAAEQEMVSGKIAKGSTVHFRVDKDVLGPDGHILIPYESTAYAKVLESRAHGMFGRPGKLDFQIESVNAADGTSVPLRAVRDATGNDQGALVIVGTVLLSVLFVLFVGENVTIPKGTTFTAYVNHDTLIAKPLPSRLTAADFNIARTVAITSPVTGGKLKKSNDYVFSCTISPVDEAAYARVYVDNNLCAWQKGNLSNIEWKNAKAKSMKKGEHELEMEITFSTGHIVKSAPVKFSVE